MLNISNKLENLKKLIPISDRQWTKFDLLGTLLVQRNLKVRYRGAIIGNLCPLANQLSQLLIYYRLGKILE